MNNYYYTRPGVTATAIKAGSRSMLHMRHAMTEAKADTPAMRWGRLAHRAILEPSTLAELVATDADKRTKDYKTLREQHGDNLVTIEERDRLAQMQERIACHQHAAQLVAGCKAVELACYWSALPYGEAKAKLDGYNADLRVLVEYKTARQIDPRAWEAASWGMGYHLQAGWYACEACRHSHLDVSGGVFFVVQESAPPYDVAVYRTDGDLLDYGHKEAVRIAAEYRACERRNEWPGAHPDLRVVAMPQWAIESAALARAPVGNAEDLFDDPFGN